MSDKIELFVNKIKIEHFLSYTIDADLFTPADAFYLELANSETEIKAGLICELKVNDQLELTGIIDKITRRVSKYGVSLSVEGRDYMGLLVDSYCEQFITVENKKLKDLAELLLAKVPFINRKGIVYQQNVTGKIKGKKQKASGSYLSAIDSAQKISQIEPGMTIFDVLNGVARSRGMLFYSLPNGTLVFGRPMATGEPEYTLQMLKTGYGNNVLESDVCNDISRRYSKVTVIGQQQGGQTVTTAASINTGGPSHCQTDSSMPFYKPYVTKDNNDGLTPSQNARLIMEKQKREGKQLNYTVARHSQNGKNWTINSLCRIKDEIQTIDGKKIDGDYLIYGRTFELSKQSGPTTKLKLGVPGLIA